MPKEILVPETIDKEILADILQTPVRTPKRGTKKELLNLASKNAQLILEEKFRLLELDDRKTTGAMKEITDALGLPVGHRIEAFDHSHTQTSFQRWFVLSMGNQRKMIIGNTNYKQLIVLMKLQAREKLSIAVIAGY